MTILIVSLVSFGFGLMTAGLAVLAFAVFAPSPSARQSEPYVQ